MNFDEAEAKFRELQTRVQRGEPISRAEYEDQVSQLAVQDERGNLWEMSPRNGQWMRFDGAEWLADTPPGREQSHAAPTGRVSIPPASAPTPPPSPPASAPSRPTNPYSKGSSLPLSGARPISPASPSGPTSRTTPSGARLVPPSGVSSVPGGSGGPSSAQRPPNAPEDDSIQPYVRVNAPEQPSAAPPSGTGGTPPGTPMPPRVLRPSPPNAGALGGPNREWVPLAIGAVVLLFCAILLYFGGRFALSAMGTPSTPTRPAVAVIPTSTVMPTAVQLPTQPVATAVSTTVTAKVNENRVNVRTGPSTKDKIITVVTRGTQLTLLGKNDAGDWYQIIAPKSTNKAWVSALTVDIVSGDPASLPVVPAGGTTAAPTAKPKATATKAP